MGRFFCAQNYAARCRNAQDVQQYGTLIPMPKLLKMRLTYDNRGTSCRFQMPLPKPSYDQNVLAIGPHLFGMSYSRICVIANQ